VAREPAARRQALTSPPAFVGVLVLIAAMLPYSLSFLVTGLVVPGLR
jgi:hypothetical protein